MVSSSCSSVATIRVSTAYLRLLILLPSTAMSLFQFSRISLITYSMYVLNRRGENGTLTHSYRRRVRLLQLLDQVYHVSRRPHLHDSTLTKAFLYSTKHMNISVLYSLVFSTSCRMFKVCSRVTFPGTNPVCSSGWAWLYWHGRLGLSFDSSHSRLENFSWTVVWRWSGTIGPAGFQTSIASNTTCAVLDIQFFRISQWFYLGLVIYGSATFLPHVPLLR